MTATENDTAALRAWRAIPQSIEQAIAGLREQDLDLRDGADGLSIRMIVHHLVEANLVASNILIAALAKSGCTFDWSWVTPGGDWMKRMGYDRAPIAPALATLRALCDYVATLIEMTGDGLGRSVQLLDAPGAKLYSKNVTGLLTQEVDHAKEHLETLKGIRNAHAR